VILPGFTLERREDGAFPARAGTGGRDGGQLVRARARGDGRAARLQSATLLYLWTLYYGRLRDAGSGRRDRLHAISGQVAGYPG
jgi:hypothetical protein